MSNRKNEDFKLDVISKIDPEIIDEVTNKRIKYINAMGKGNKKKLTAIIAIAAAVAVLLSVMAVIIIPLLKPDEVTPPSGTVPIYTGMTVSSANGESLSLGLKPLSANGQGFGMMLLDNSNTEGNEGNHGSNNPNKKPVEDIVNDSGTLAPTQSEQMYYAKQNEDIIITIHFDNPDEYKIMSFKLNGKAYADYMFEYGSDYENIMIKVNVGEALGIVDYTIDAIQYADRDVLKYVEMKGDPTLSIGVYNENVPVPAITNEKIGTNSVSFDIDLPGANNLAALSGGKLYAIVADDTEIVKQQELNIGQTSVNFDGLKTGTAYRYAIIAEYDAQDGEGYKSYILTEKEFTTAEVITLENLNVGTNEISFDLVWNEAFASSKPMTSFELYQGETKVKDIDVNATSITDLISDTEYTVIAKYDNNGSTETETYTFKTKAKTVAYTVNHYIQNVENDNYTLKETEHLSVVENTDISLEVKSYQGFRSPEKKTVTVKSDGSLVLDYYYTRNSYEVTFITNGGRIMIFWRQTLKYDAVLSLPDVVRGDDTFGGWFTDVNLTKAFTQTKMGDSDIKLYAYWEGESKPGSFSYSREEGITGFKGTQAEIVIPSYINGVRVTTIGEAAFRDCTNITSVTIPNTVTTIGGAAFQGCKQITSVTIPDSVTTIEGAAFQGCEQITSVTIPDSVTTIEGAAFNGCIGLKSLIIGNGVKEIGERAFSFCPKLTDLTIGANVEKIGDSAFSTCCLKSIVIPDSVITIGDNAFVGCTKLTSVVIGSGVESIGNNAFYGCSIENLYIKNIEKWLNISRSKAGLHYPQSHNIILDENGNEVTEVIIPNSVTSIGDYAFYGCSGLTSITIPDSVTSIGGSAFYGCSGLMSINIPDRATLPSLHPQNNYSTL